VLKAHFHAFGGNAPLSGFPSRSSNSFHFQRAIRLFEEMSGLRVSAQVSFAAHRYTRPISAGMIELDGKGQGSEVCERVIDTSENGSCKLNQQPHSLSSGSTMIHSGGTKVTSVIAVSG
jgi:hypothetical protein